ncbi:MAG TPA: malto-oligosyltrehalose trehalohydrolase [Roseiflexaceae bacterium]|nr:malto-oligosyltrehalose trehalohydrolase [Roseiflexaceae bacterium]
MTADMIGAVPEGDGTRFRVWATGAQRVDLVIYGGSQAVGTHPLVPEPDGYFGAHIAGARPGDRYAYRLDGDDPRPDPASRYQPEGVHGPSQVVDPSAYAWGDGAWKGIPLEDAVIYELHIGTFTPRGTFEAAIERLDHLVELGITAIEIMPVADFPGNRNWGYDGVCLWAPARAYGGPEGLRKLVDAAHARGLAVLLDVVYNHLGPDGNYLRLFSPDYFTDHHKTPWGDALNFDAPGSPAVRAFFVANALHWMREYHLDGLRLDATHAIKDDSDPHILAEIAAAIRAALPPERHFLLIAEDERNEPRLVRQAQEPQLHRRDAEDAEVQHSKLKTHNSNLQTGYGLDGVWADDFHHEVRVSLAGDHEGYYADYSGAAEDLAATLRQGWFYTGQVSAFSGHPRGRPADDVPPPRFVHCIQNHDQVGNRALGDRLNHNIELDAYRLASALLLLSPYTPLLWMGQEWAASTPFLFFTDHNPDLGRLVTEGRRAEFAGFTAFGGEQVPDPQDRATFERSKLRWQERGQPPHAGVLLLYRDLLGLRRQRAALLARGRDSFAVAALGESGLALRRDGASPEDALLVVASLRGPLRVDLTGLPLAAAAEPHWTPLLDTEDPRYGGRGAARLEKGTLALGGTGLVLLGLG